MVRAKVVCQKKVTCLEFCGLAALSDLVHALHVDELLLHAIDLTCSNGALKHHFISLHSIHSILRYVYERTHKEHTRELQPTPKKEYVGSNGGLIGAKGGRTRTAAQWC